MGTKMITQSGNLQLETFTPMSELICAKNNMECLVHPIGTIYPPQGNMSPKTKVKYSILKPLLKTLISEWTEHPDENYWRLPDFRGHMCTEEKCKFDHPKTGLWESPYQNMFKTSNHASMDDYFMWLALLDYIKGMDSLDCDGYTILTEEEALSGIPGTIIHSINTRTSAGPPYNKSKRNYFHVEHGNSCMHDKMCDILDELEEILAAGEIPQAYALCTLKDEAVKPEKIPRVFNVLSASYNLLVKRHFAPIKNFIRTNFVFFESAVGINMTSNEVNKVINRLAVVDPELKNLAAADVKAMDKSYNGKHYDFTAEVPKIISGLIGTNPRITHSLVLGLKHTVYNIKNDLFGAFHDPSGCDITVEQNGWDMSLHERAVYYRMLYLKDPSQLPTRKEVSEFVLNEYHKNPFGFQFGAKLTFRRDVALIHYGDDNLKAMNFKLDGPLYTKIWAEEVGMIMTDANKTGEMKPETIHEVTFLKRNFVYWPDLAMYVAPLNLKSMARMISIKKESVLSERDHAAVAISEVLREAVLHGESFYNDLYSKLEAVAIELKITNNPNLTLKPFSHWYAKLVDGSFQTWLTREDLPRLEVDGVVLF